MLVGVLAAAGRCGRRTGGRARWSGGIGAGRRGRGAAPGHHAGARAAAARSLRGDGRRPCGLVPGPPGHAALARAAHRAGPCCCCRGGRWSRPTRRCCCSSRVFAGRRPRGAVAGGVLRRRWLVVDPVVVRGRAARRGPGRRPARAGGEACRARRSWCSASRSPAALALESVAVTPSTSAQPVAPWSGAVLMLAVAAALVAAAVAARGSRARFSRATFTWRQPLFAVVVLLAVVSPLVWGVTWLGRGATDPLDRGSANPLPAFVRAQSALPEQIRTLVLEPADGRLAYTVLRSRDARWGDVETAPPVDRLRLDGRRGLRPRLRTRVRPGRRAGRPGRPVRARRPAGRLRPRGRPGLRPWSAAHRQPR